MSIFKGSCTALITPFDDNGVNLSVAQQLIDYQLNNGTDALLICGTTGEPSTMTTNEKHKFIDFAIKYINKRAPVIVGTGSNNTAQAVEDSIFAQNAGADALLIVTPYYNKCTQNGIVAHFREISNSVNIPIIAYNVPSRTNVNITPSTCVKLCDIKNVVAIKEASGNMEQITEMARLTRGKLDIYSGDDGIILPIMSVGAIGVISVVSNVAPLLVSSLTTQILKGDFISAMKLQDDIKELTNVMFCEVNPIPIKTSMKLLGYNVGNLRLPLTEMEADNLTKLKVVLAKHNFIK